MELRIRDVIQTRRKVEGPLVNLFCEHLHLFGPEMAARFILAGPKSTWPTKFTLLDFFL
jgi:hypothetical protein